MRAHLIAASACHMRAARSALRRLGRTRRLIQAFTTRST